MTITLADDALVAEVARLAGSERQATASLIAHLAELYGRRLHLRAGFASLFTYCTAVLRLSEHEAYDRMKAAKVARRCPAVLGLLESGRVNLTTVRLLAPHLTRANQEGLFAEAAGKSKRQVQELLARRFPRPDVAASIRKLPEPRPDAVGVAPLDVSASERSDLKTATRPALPGRASPSGSASFDGTMAVSATAVRPSPVVPPLTLPLAPDRYRVQFTASERLCEKLRLAQDLLRHAVPSGEPAEIFERALDALIEAAVKQRYAVTERPRATRARAEESRDTPAGVKRAVFVRDGGRCAYVAPGGRRCGERSFVEFHHVVPYATGGRATVDNIELRCRLHNAYEAEVYFGPMREHVPARVSRATRFRSGTTSKMDWRTPLRV